MGLDRFAIKDILDLFKMFLGMGPQGGSYLNVSACKFKVHNFSLNFSALNEQSGESVILPFSARETPEYSFGHDTSRPFVSRALRLPCSTLLRSGHLSEAFSCPPPLPSS